MLHYPCPGFDVIKRLIIGDAEELEVRLFEEHLEKCDGCFAILQRVKVDDPLVEDLENAGSVPAGIPSDAALQPLLDRLYRLPQEFTESPGDEDPTEPAVPRHSGPASSLDSLPAGLAVPEYEILEEVGRGGMSIVFRARQVPLNRLVALKMLLGGSCARPEQLARFRLEAEAVARLQHPHVVQIFEVGEHRGMPFCALEFVEGGSLAEMLQARPLPAAAAARLTALLALAAHAAHQAGIIHRDLKPANVLLAPSDRSLAVSLGEKAGQRYEPKIADFGLAKRLDVPTGYSLSGDVMGTPSYMAPEQAAGRSKDIGPAADVWALGAILYETLAGRPPFRGVTVLDTLEQVRLVEPVSLSLLAPSVPRDLETICLKCLHKDPHRRYASAADLAEDLRRFENHEPIQARPLGALERSIKWVRRHPTWSVAIVAAGLLGLGLVAGLFWHTTRLESAFDLADQERQAAKRSADEAQRERESAERSADEARSQRYAADLRLANQFMQSGDVFGMGELLDRNAAEIGPDRRGFAWGYMQRQQRGPRHAFRASDTAPLLLTFSPDGKRLTTANSTGGNTAAIVWDLATGKQSFTAPLFYTNPNPAVASLSADGRTLAAWCQLHTVEVWDVDTRQKKARLPFHDVQAVALSPDGRWLAVASPTRALIWDVVQSRVQCAFDPGGMELFQLVFSPDGRSLAGRSGIGLRVWCVDGGKVQTSLVRAMGWPHAFAWSPSGRMLAVIDEDDRLHLLETARLVELGRWNLPCKDVNCVAFTPDGRTLALGGADGQLVWWDVERQQFLGMNRWQARGLRQLAFSTDGRSLAAASEDGHVCWMDARPPRRFERLTPELAVGSALAFSPDGNLLAAVGPRRGVVLLDAATLQVRARLEVGSSRIGLMAFLPAAASNPSPVLLTVGAADGALALWDAGHGKLLRELPWHRGNPTRCLAVSPDGKRAAVGQEGGRVKVWDLAAGTYLSMEHGATVACLAFSPDGLTLATAGENRLLKFWDMGAKTQRTPVAQITLDSQTMALTFAPDNQYFLAATVNGGVHVWKRDRNSSWGDRSVLPKSHHVAQLLWSGDGRSLVGVGSGEPVRCWNFPTRALVWMTTDFWDPVTAAAWSSDSKRLALSLGGERAEIWNLETSEVRQPAGQGLAGQVHSVVFTPDGQHLITASEIKAREIRKHELAVPLLPFRRPGASDRRLLARTTDAIRVWNVANGREQAPAPLSEQARLAPPSLAALAPDGAVLVCGSEDGSIGVWDRRSRRCKANRFISEPARKYAALLEFVPRGIGVYPQYPEGVRTLAFSCSGRWLAALGTRGQVRVWETTNWTEHWTMPKARGEVTWLAFAPDERLVSCQEGKLHWWDVEERKLHRTLGGTGTAGVQCGAFAPGGGLLATTATDGRIHLWDLAAEKATPLIGHRDRVTALAFSPDGKTLASASWDQSVRLWNAAGREVAVLEGARGRLWSLAFSRDGNTLAAGGEGHGGGGDVVLWRAGH